MAAMNEKKLASIYSVTYNANNDKEDLIHTSNKQSHFEFNQPTFWAKSTPKDRVGKNWLTNGPFL